MTTYIDCLSTEAIHHDLHATSIGQRIHLYDEVDSTNDRLRILARAGAIDGTVVLAESQRMGRGRLGATWFSPDRVNLYVSVLFRRPLTPTAARLFSFIASLAIGDAIRDEGVVPANRWPNDVMIDGKKVAGVLGDAEINDGRVDYLILGAGVNLNVTPSELHEALGASGLFASSVAAAAKRDIDRNVFTAHYLNHLDDWVARWAADGPGAVVAAWRDRDILSGRRVRVREGTAEFDGRVIGLDATGYLIVRDSLGRRRIISYGEIRVAD